jgi:1-aminocyclopropane-1-carboxylate deaminase
MLFFDENKSTTNQEIPAPLGYRIAVKREDLLDPQVSGNKYRKLKYILEEAKTQQVQQLLTFGGAFSNHLAALASAGKRMGFSTLGIVRGEEWQSKIDESPTLTFCKTMGMELHCVSRAAYQLKEKSLEVAVHIKRNPQLLLIPEGGTSHLAVKGCREILTQQDQEFDTVCCSIGTGGTMAGLMEAAAKHQTVIGYNALKNEGILATLETLTPKKNGHVDNDYTFGGYAKVNEELIRFINTFYQQTNIPLDPVYTGKLVFGIFERIKLNQWYWGKRILIIHSGGLQGIQGMNQRLKKKGMPIIEF